MLKTTTEIEINDNTCKACKGKGVQKRKDGIKLVCPSCHGTGIYVIPQEAQPAAPWPTYPIEPWEPRPAIPWEPIKFPWDVYCVNDNKRGLNID